jgi:hypothetical protein
MLLAEDAFSLFGIALGFALWLALVYAVYRWGPFEDEGSIRAAFRAVRSRRAAGGDRRR